MWQPPYDASYFMKVACVVGWFGVWWAMYSFTNDQCANSIRAVEYTPPGLVTPGIIQPWTATIYLFGGMLLPLLPFFYYWSVPQLRFVLACYAVTSALAFACYWIWPMKITRPSFEGSGLGNYLMRCVLSVDGSANCAPSSHVYYTILSALLVDAAHPGWGVRITVWSLAIVISATTITTGQHYWIDVPTGVVAAILGYAIVLWLLPLDTINPVAT